MRMRFLSAAVCAVVLAAHAAPAGAATITVVNLDGANEGFNDPTPVSPIGGNPGTTLGEQRLIAFQYAADIWAALLHSDVEVRVGANFNPMSCDAFGATLGGAGPETVHRDFANAPEPATWYPQALANSHAGVDLDPLLDDVFAIFNSVLGTTCPYPNGWYYGLDASPPGFDIDFASVVLHEIGHGIGFLTLVGLNSGTKFASFDDAYMLHLENHTSGLHYPDMTNGQRVSSNVGEPHLHWTGPSVVASGASLVGGREPISGHVEIFAPNPADPGSSLSHFATTLSPSEVMEPFYVGAVHDPGLAVDLMFDIGWVPSDCGNGTLDPGEVCDDGNTIRDDGCSSCEVDTCHECAGEPSVCAPQTGPACDDDQACTTSDTCQAGVCVGDSTPRVGCRTATQPDKGLLLLKDKFGGRKDKLIWKLLQGEATSTADFGNPPAGTDHLLCVYDRTGGDDTVVMSMLIPGGSAWQAKSNGFKYNDKNAAASGVRAALFKAGVDGKAKIIIKGKGLALPMTELDELDPPLTVQLGNDTTCWEATFDNNVLTSNPELFKAKSD